MRVYAGFDDTRRGLGQRQRSPAAADRTIPIAPWSMRPDRRAAPERRPQHHRRRTCEDIGDWRFYFRLENLDKSPVEGLTWAIGPAKMPE